jgi:hypothetical protein
MGAEFHATEVMTTLIVAFCNFMNARIIARKVKTVVGSPTGQSTAALVIKCQDVGVGVADVLRQHVRRRIRHSCELCLSRYVIDFLIPSFMIRALNCIPCHANHLDDE